MIQAIFPVIMLVPVAFGEKDRLHFLETPDTGLVVELGECPQAKSGGHSEEEGSLPWDSLLHWKGFCKVRGKDNSNLYLLIMYNLCCCILVTCRFYGVVACIHSLWIFVHIV